MILNIDDFLQSKYLEQLTNESKEILEKLILRLENEGLDFQIKTRNDNAIALVLKNNQKKNICIILTYKKHVRIKINNIYDKNINFNEEIDDSLIDALKNKANQIIDEKVQMSLYLDKSMFQKIENKAMNYGKSVHDVIVNMLNEELYKEEYFINKSHRDEFEIFLKDAGLLSEEKYIYGLNEKDRKAVAVFYVISAYQEQYAELNEGVKFVFDSEKRMLNGPADVIENWEVADECPSYKMYGFMEAIINNEEIKVYEIFKYGFDDDAIFIFKNVLNILNGNLTIKDNRLIEVKRSKAKAPAFKL